MPGAERRPCDRRYHPTPPNKIMRTSHTAHCNDDGILCHHYYQTRFIMASASQELSSDIYVGTYETTSHEEYSLSSMRSSFTQVSNHILAKEKVAKIFFSGTTSLIETKPEIYHPLPCGRRCDHNHLRGHLVWQP